MHDGVGAAIGTFIMWFGMLGLAALFDYVTNKNSSTEGTAEQTEKTTHLKYSIGWSDLQND